MTAPSTDDAALETGAAAPRTEVSPGEDSDLSAQIAIGIASVVVTFLGVVVGVLWRDDSTVYINCKCCNSSGSGPAVVVGARTPKKMWLPVRMASDTLIISTKPTFTNAVGSQAIVSSVTDGFEHMSWTAIPAGTSMSLRLTLDGRSYIFESCATSTMERGRKVVVGGIKRAKAIEGEKLAQVVDIVTVNEACALATEYPSHGCFRILKKCASHVSSLATYAVVETIVAEQLTVLVLR